MRSRPRGRRVPGSKPDSTEDPPDLLHVKSHVVAKRSPAGVVRKFGEGVPDQVSSSSSDLGSKWRGPSQSSLRVASKQREIMSDIAVQRRYVCSAHPLSMFINSLIASPIVCAANDLSDLNWICALGLACLTPQLDGRRNSFLSHGQSPSAPLTQTVPPDAMFVVNSLFWPLPDFRNNAQLGPHLEPI
ncbi:hypothetical protein AVEN_167697-1 [Araneus ventricosus]|uniref:Uncharacterized protein n=1 Tax=Araneus ventricosus TaxID=182803 RepID=A0A4Y2MM64_ARAVE|nr:hypothetical protein AVEN_167697-1 [Araneus ventricosus]